MKRLGLASAGLKIFDRAGLAQAAAEALDVADQPFVAGGFGLGHEVGERAPHQLLLGASLDGLETGDDAGFGGEGCEQRLREAVDGLDLQAAGTVEYLGEQLPRPLPSLWTIAFAEVQEVRSEIAVLQPHPLREPASNAIGHFGGGCLGEGQAEDRFWTRALQQQAQHARGQHLGLARSGRCRQRRMHGGVGRHRLLALELGQGLEAGAHPAFQSAPNAIEIGAMANSNDTDRASEQRRSKLVKAGFAVGIGSAAIVAALLYASQVKKKPRARSISGRTILRAASADRNRRRAHRPG